MRSKLLKKIVVIFGNTRLSLYTININDYIILYYQFKHDLNEFCLTKSSFDHFYKNNGSGEVELNIV